MNDIGNRDLDHPGLFMVVVVDDDEPQQTCGQTSVEFSRQTANICPEMQSFHLLFSIVKVKHYNFQTTTCEQIHWAELSGSFCVYMQLPTKS